MQLRYPLSIAAWTTLSAVAYAQSTVDQNYRLLPAKEPPTAPTYGTLPTTPQQPAIFLPAVPGTPMQPALPYPNPIIDTGQQVQNLDVRTTKGGGTTDAWVVLRNPTGALIGAWPADVAEPAFDLQKRFPQLRLELNGSNTEVMGFVRNQEAKVSAEAADAVESATKAAVERVCALPAKPSQFHVMATVNASVLFAAASMQFDFTWNANELCAAQ